MEKVKLVEDQYYPVAFVIEDDRELLTLVASLNISQKQLDDNIKTTQAIDRMKVFNTHTTSELSEALQHMWCAFRNYYVTTMKHFDS